MALPRALVFSTAVPVASMAAIHAGAYATTGLAKGFTSELANRSLTLIGKQLSLGWAIVFVIMAGLAFGAWGIARRSRSHTGPLRIVLLAAATLLAVLVPLGIAVFVFDSLIGQLTPLLISGAAVVMVAGAESPNSSTVPVSNASIPFRTNFGRRNA